MRTFQSNRSGSGPREWFGGAWRFFTGEHVNDNDDDRELASSKMFQKPPDHRQELYYDPIIYNDDPDPRFDDE